MNAIHFKEKRSGSLCAVFKCLKYWEFFLWFYCNGFLIRNKNQIRALFSQNMFSFTSSLQFSPLYRKADTAQAVCSRAYIKIAFDFYKLYGQWNERVESIALQWLKVFRNSIMFLNYFLSHRIFFILFSSTRDLSWWIPKWNEHSCQREKKLATVAHILTCLHTYWGCS